MSVTQNETPKNICKNKSPDGSCNVVRSLISVAFKPHDSACKACSDVEPPRSVNQVTANLSCGVLIKAGKRPSSKLAAIAGLQVPEHPPETGPGTELKKLLSWFASPSKKCNCSTKAALMDSWGPQKCRQQREVIVTWLVDEAVGLAVPRQLVPKSAIRAIVTLAINTAEKQITDSEVNQSSAEADRINQVIAQYNPRPNGSGDQSAIVRESELTRDWPFVWTYWGDGAVGDEIRYSIRSVLKHQPGARIVIVGDRPGWYIGEHFAKPRISRRPHQAFKDCYSKILHAAGRLKRFVWMMDDVYWIKPFSMRDAITPKYVRHVSQHRFNNWTPPNKWARTRADAYQWLLENNRPTYDFAAHLPQPIVSANLNKLEQELKLFENYRNWECLYFNSFHAADAQDWGRRFLRVTTKRETIQTPHAILNHTHRNYTGAVEAFLSDTLSEKSIVEQ